MIKQCKLLEVPPIGEMNHGLGLCYCQLCDCGEHVCPADINKNQHYLKSAIRSNYKKDFTKKPMTRSQ